MSGAAGDIIARVGRVDAERGDAHRAGASSEGMGVAETYEYVDDGAHDCSTGKWPRWPLCDCKPVS
jgi:hypothetical protein